MTTTRERREARAARLSEWAAKRDAKADAGFSRADPYRGDTAFWTQPGRIIERERVHAAGERAMADRKKAQDMRGRSIGIEQQLDRSIYSDDTDAIERLEERIAALEDEQSKLKAANVAYRKEHKAELAAMGPYMRNQSMPAPTWHLSNLSADIRRNKQRLEQIKRAQDTPNKPQRVINARRDGSCERCGESIAIGDTIGKFSDGWLLVKLTDSGYEPACA